MKLPRRLSQRDSINYNHPRINTRSRLVQELRDELFVVLDDYRSQGEQGKKAAQALLNHKKNNDLSYQTVMKYGFGEKSAEKIIELGYSTELADNLTHFSGLSQDTALKLIAGGYGEIIGDNLENFESLNYDEIEQRLIEQGHQEYVDKYFRKQIVEYKQENKKK